MDSHFGPIEVFWDRSFSAPNWPHLEMFTWLWDTDIELLACNSLKIVVPWVFF